MASRETIRPLDLTPLTAHAFLDVPAHADGDAFFVTVNGERAEFELESGGGVSAGRIAVPIGATLILTSQNIEAALKQRFGALLLFSTRLNYTDIAGRNPDISVQVGIIAGGLTAGNLSTAQRGLPSVALFFERTILTADVTRGGIGIITVMDKISYVQVHIYASTTFPTLILWTGRVDILGNVISLVNQGATLYAAGNVLRVIAMGDKHE